MFIPLGFPGFQPTVQGGIYPFWGEGYEHQQAFWVHLSKGYAIGVCTLAPLDWYLLAGLRNLTLTNLLGNFWAGDWELNLARTKNTRTCVVPCQRGSFKRKMVLQVVCSLLAKGGRWSSRTPMSGSMCELVACVFPQGTPKDRSEPRAAFWWPFGLKGIFVPRR